MHGEIQSTFHKRLLPNYSVFDERRYFTPGTAPLELIEIKGVKIGLAICEDIWSPTGPLLDLARGGAEVVLVPNASPFRQGKALGRDIMISSRSADNSCAIVYVNQVGGQDELVFDGGSVIFDHEGQLLAQSAPVPGGRHSLRSRRETRVSQASARSSRPGAADAHIAGEGAVRPRTCHRTPGPG